MIKHAYIHIPFCKSKCKYCSFVSGLNIKNKEPYINALIQQIKKEYKNDKLKTLYIGGGTPSLLNETDIKRIISLFSFNNKPEITLEVNPETVDYKKFKYLKDIGINRISLGIQTFDNEILKVIGRNHNEKTIFEAIEIIKKCGFSNISIDLIYGLPYQTLETLKKDIEKAVFLDIQHISTYGLKIEENSYFKHHIPQNTPDDDTQAEMFLYLCSFLKKHKFIHYEISNFALKGYNSLHNCAYWQNKNYYGFGLNASGYDKDIRYKNTSIFNKYINNPFLKEEKNSLNIKETMENEIFLALRLKNGININKINKKYNIDFINQYKNIIEKYQELNLLKSNTNKCYLTNEGMLLSNNIMSDFIDLN